jgi:hypothetical protein
MAYPSMNILVRFNPQFGRCPKCKSIGHLRRSRSHNMWEQIVRKTTIMKLFRCQECGWRGFRSTLIITKKSFKTIFLYLILILVTVIVASFVIRKIAP